MKQSIRNFLNDRELRGIAITTDADLLRFYGKDELASVMRGMRRLVASGEVESPRQGFFIKIPVKYKLRGKVPPLFYIDDLMRHLKRPYYVGLLSAAAMWGAGHQRVQHEQVITVGRPFNNSKDKCELIRWAYRDAIPENSVITKNGEGGEIKYSDPLLTAFDLIHFQHLCGGLSNVATVLAELRDSIDLLQMKQLVESVSVADIQRLGYLLEFPLADKALADTLFDQVDAIGIRFQRRRLESSLHDRSQDGNRWKIVVNTEVEVDDL